MTDLDRLIAAVEAGEAFPRHFRACFGDVCQDMALMRRQDDARDAYRGSLDAALRLHEALLPGWWYRLTKGKHGQEAIVQGDLFAGEHAEASAENTARAWLLSILRALKAKGDA